MKSETEFLKDCESICFECASKDELIILHDGVALCRKCYIDEYNERIKEE